MSPEDVTRRRVNIVQACAIAGVSRSTIYNWIRAGVLDIVRTPMGKPRIYVDTLLTEADARSGDDGRRSQRRAHA